MLIKPLPLLNFFVVVVMFSIGLRTSGRKLLYVVRDRALLLRTLLANCIVIPAISFLLVRTFPLNPDATIGILLLAAIPGTPIALRFTRMAKNHLIWIILHDGVRYEERGPSITLRFFFASGLMTVIIRSYDYVVPEIARNLSRFVV